MGIWQAVLGREDITAGDDLFDLGASSLEAVRILSRLSDALAVTVPLTRFFTSPTPAGLAAAALLVRETGGMTASGASFRAAPAEDGARTSSAGADLAPARPTSAPVGASQEGMLWHEQFAPGSFNLPPLVRQYRGRLDVTALGRALSDVANRHAPLRTTFVLEGYEPVQRVGAPHPRSLRVDDLGDLEPADQRAQIGREVADAAARPFDLAEGPLFEPRLYRLAADDHVLVIRLHHLVFDDWSVDVFRRDLSAFYIAHTGGPASSPAPLEPGFPELCRRQRRVLTGPARAEELRYWRRQLAGSPFTVPLPIGEPGRPRGSPYPAAVPLRRALPASLVLELRSVARRAGATFFMAVLATFAVTVSGYSGQEDLLLASVVANRGTTELEPLIACLTKKVLLRLRLGGDPSFLELLDRARDAVLGALDHQDLPYETVLQEVLGGEAARHGLVPDVSLMFQAELAPQSRLVLPGVSITGFDLGPAPRQAHFAAGDRESANADEHPWGAGLYQGTFLILSVLEAGESASLVARGVFHPPAVEGVMARMEEILSEVVANPEARLSQLGLGCSLRPSRHHADGSENFRGFRFEPRRIASVLAHCPGVADAAVVVREDAGDGEAVVAYVEPCDGAAPPTMALLRTHLWAALPGYLWPSALVLVAALPRLPEGDVDLAALPVPDGAGAATVGGTGASPAEARLLASLWAEVLGTDEVPADTNYWQRFSFLEVLRRAGEAGLLLSTEQVRRNRTLQTLGVDIASCMARAKATASAPPGGEVPPEEVLQGPHLGAVHVDQEPSVGRRHRGPRSLQ